MRAVRRPIAALAAALLVTAPAPAPPSGDTPPDPAPGLAAILEEDLRADVDLLASPALEGRDSPSVGLARAAEHVAARLVAAGYVPAGDDDDLLRGFRRDLPAPVLADCALAVVDAEGATTTFTPGDDFVPVWRTGGEATGEAVVLAYGIDPDADRGDELTGDLTGRVAVILEGEPARRGTSDRSELSPAADLYSKLGSLRDAELAGAVVARRPPRTADGRPVAPAPLGFRHTWAVWSGERDRTPAPVDLPVLEVTAAVAERLTGVDLLARAAAVDGGARAPRPLHTGREVTVRAAWRQEPVDIDNVVGLLPGSDPALADEVVVIGAHYDHVGVDPRGRVGLGADDNASGVAALLEVAEALAVAPPRRSVLVCAFAAEEDGLLGSRALCDDPPVPADRMVAMLNMDMVGRGDPRESVVIGVDRNPALEDVLDRARRAVDTGVTELVTGRGRELFRRSDHFPFHRVGVPALFFFEGLPLSDNEDYHTWRDTPDEVDVEKVANTARLVYATAWLLANDDGRPPPPRR